ncbi:MAG TPA: flagellar motor switch protein FliN [Ignavibacteriaceae bacterium]|nr:flagellar motor switch protein FliN [Ignavibacteriaceae bacterium]
MEDLREEENLLNQQDSTNDSDGYSTADNRNGNSKVLAGVADFEEFDDAKIKGIGTNEKLDFLKDLQLNVYIELGRTQMQIKEILELERGYVIELDKLASEPVDIYVNNKKIAEGEVVVIDKHFGIRITNLNEASTRLKGLY